MFLFVLALLAVAWTAVRIGSGVEMQAAGSGWMVTPSPGPLSGGVIVHSPERQWKIVMCWSLLGVAMAVITMFSSGGNPLSRIWYISLGSAFALGLWGFAWHTKTLEISANDQGVRTTSALGWREVPWALVRGMEDQDLATTYYNGRMRMWELPFPGSTIRVMAFNDERGRALMSFSPELVPKEGLQSLFDLCRARTGAKLEKRQIRMPF
jgi:hypothetical protein